MAVTGVFPAVARHAEGAANPAGSENDRAAVENLEAATVAVVRERSRNSVAVLDEIDYGAFHVHIDSHLHRIVLESANHLQAGAVPDVRETRILMSAEITLQDATVGRPIENSSPRLELAHPVRRFPGVQLRHPPVVEVLPAAHRIGKVDAPVVAVV